MIAIISDNEELGSNLEETLNLEDHDPIVLFDTIQSFSESKFKTFDLIVYNNSEDADGERFRWHLIANPPDTIAPVIFLNMVDTSPDKSGKPYYYVQLPFESDDFVDLVNSLINKPVKSR